MARQEFDPQKDLEREGWRDARRGEKRGHTESATSASSAKKDVVRATAAAWRTRRLQPPTDSLSDGETHEEGKKDAHRECHAP
jgi:hypothetical protein